MNRLPRLVLVLLTPFVLAWSASAHAASCSNGKTLYNEDDARTSPTSCSNSNCHGTNPGNNKNNILNGAGSRGAT